MIRVLIVEDEPIVQELLKSFLRSVSDRYTLAGCVTEAANAEVLCEDKQVDLVLMDVCTAHNSSGLAATARIKQRYPEVRVIIVTSAPEYRFLEKAEQAGADSFWYKNVSRDELLSVMDRTMEGERIYPDKTPDVELGLATGYELTAREKEVLLHLADGVSTRVIAERMGISADGVNEHIKHLKGKTGCSTKTQLAVLASRTRFALPEY